MGHGPSRAARLLATVAAIGLLGSPSARGQEIDYGDLYDDGIPFAEFLADADRRRQAWLDHYENGAPTFPAVRSARAVGAEIRFLVVAEDWCGDSVNTVPYVARLVEQVSGWELRVIDSKAGAEIMEANRTPDGRAATPTIVVLDADDQPLGVFIERPTILQDWFLASEDELAREDLYEQKYTWYSEDAGEATVAELTEIASRVASDQ